jgi:hypothetical protein
MNPKAKMSLLTGMTALLLCAGPVLAKDDFPEVTAEGLHRVHDSKLSVVYIEPGADFSGYTEVMLLEPGIAFKKNWLRDQNRSITARVTKSDMEKIKTRLAAEFTEVFTEVLQENDGYPVVDTTDDHVLLLRPAIINLDAAAPDVQSASRSYTYAESAGEMTLYLEVYDSVTGDLIAKALDRRADRRSGYMSWQTSVSNKQAATRILKGWAQVLRDGLDEAHAASKSAD